MTRHATVLSLFFFHMNDKLSYIRDMGEGKGKIDSKSHRRALLLCVELKQQANNVSGFVHGTAFHGISAMNKET